MGVPMMKGMSHLRGYDFQPRNEEEVDAELLTRLDMCWSVGKVLSNTDPLRGLPFQLRAVLQRMPLPSRHADASSIRGTPR